ncbi:amino acid ABC transporter permease [uncultured Cohaesibacter sp.]|uniref:amino acid ABC transporter permease n=1 Tax=uncultured Cohaesibacter sp. TaxID=1002546 RepID=UPI0029C627F8|nr:amino acid ABC transporter permease [uncultured Cohaesibacter sp.]
MANIASMSPQQRLSDALVWLRREFFSSWINAAFTLLFAAFIYWAIRSILDWMVLDAVWRLADRDLCGHEAGACWAVIEDRWRLIFFGLYPYEEQWRSSIACLAVIVTIVCTCLPVFWTLVRLALLWIAGFGVFFAFMHGGFAGLSVVTTEQWGGLSLTLFIFASVFLVGMPLAVLFALARRSSMPVIAKGMGLFIDLVRSLPLLAILFSAAVVIPILVPDWLQGTKLARVILAYAVFFAAYQSEIIRSGFQAIPQGQEEAATAMGMPYMSVIFDILLPQAFRKTLPSSINQAVITFKETSIVTIIGFFELMASGKAVIGTDEWGAQFVEIYVFLAFVYFIFVFGLSRYGAWLETRMRVGHG